MITTVWILAAFSTLVLIKMSFRMFSNPGLSGLGWALWVGSAPIAAVTYGILYTGSWAAYAAQWAG